MDIITNLHLLLIISMLILLYPITLHFLHKLRHLPPTPFPTLPILGHIYYFFPYSGSYSLPFHRALSTISRRHGPIVFLHLGSRPALLVSSPSAARECFTQNDVVFANRPDLLSGKHFGYNFTSLAWSSYSHRWRNLRRISTLELLSSHKLNVLSSIRAEAARSMIVKLFKRNNLSDLIDMRKLLFEHTYSVVMAMIFGRKPRGGNSETEAFREIVEEMSRVTLEANAVDFVPIVGWVAAFGKHVERKLRSVQEKRDKFMENVMEEWRRDEDGKPRLGKYKSLMQTLVEMQKAEPETYTDETIRNLLLVLIQGASHTSSTTLEWALSRLLQNPSILARARSYIDNLVGKNRLITQSDVSKLPYLRHIINETLRMHPAAPLLAPHVSSQNCTVGGYLVPRGTLLLVNVWDIQNNPETWKDPDRFMPERFEATRKSSGDHDEYFRYGPFGWGRRACPGENMALQMVELALGCLIQCFEWEKSDDEQMDMREGRGIISPRVQPLKATCVPRPFLVHLLS